MSNAPLRDRADEHYSAVTLAESDPPEKWGGSADQDSAVPPSLVTGHSWGISARVARGLVVAVSFALIITNVWLVLSTRARAIDQAVQANTNLARAVAERVEGSITDAEHILHGVALRFEAAVKRDGLANLQVDLDSHADVAAHIEGLYVLAADGRLVAGSQTPGSALMAASGAEIIGRHHDPAVSFALGDPKRIESNGAWVVLLSRRLHNAQGTLGGAIVATLSVTHLRTILDRLELGRSAAITVTFERTVLVRRPYRDAPVGAVAPESVFRRIFRGERAGTREEPSPVDGVVRLYSYDSMAKYPLRVTVAAAKSEVLKDWQHSAILQTAWISFLGIVLWCSATWIETLLRRQIVAEGQMRQARDALAQANVELARLAQYDGLTGLPNRRFFDMRLRKVFRHAQRHQRPLAVVMIDVDNFKHFNDLYGHVAGDQCLRDVAQALGGIAARPEDLVARYGGEEMVLLLPETNAEGASQVAEVARGAVEALQLPHAASPQSIVTVSAGIAAWVPSASESPYQLVESADAALYHAKRNGKNIVSSDPTDFGLL